MRFYERWIYTTLFLCNKYFGGERVLSWYENTLIRKYIATKYRIEPMEIPSVDASELTDNLFRKLSNNYRRPILIKGFMKGSDGVGKWDLGYLSEKVGDFKVNVLSTNTSKLQIHNMPFNQFVNRIDENIYLNNNHTILSAFPEIYEDIRPEFENLVGTLSSCNLRNIHIANLFIGNNNEKTTGSNMHCGGSGNFFCMLKGRKHWTLIDPSYSPLLKARVSQSGIHAQTLFDMLDSPLDRLPEIFQRLPRYEVMMEEGDVLWNAPWWWHRITNDSGLSIGMAIRNNKVTWLNLLNNATFTLSGWTYLVYNTLLLNIYERFLPPNQHFVASKNEDKNDNVLYQIDQLVQQYPTSTYLHDIIN